MFGYRPPNISHSYNARPCTKFRLFAAARVTAMALPACIQVLDEIAYDLYLLDIVVRDFYASEFGFNR